MDPTTTRAEEAGRAARQGGGEDAERRGQGAAQGGGEAGVGGGQAGAQAGQGAGAGQLHEGRGQGAHQALILLARRPPQLENPTYVFLPIGRKGRVLLHPIGRET